MQVEHNQPPKNTVIKVQYLLINIDLKRSILKESDMEKMADSTQRVLTLKGKSIEKAYDLGYDVFRESVAELPNDEWVNLITTLDEYST